MGSGRGRKEERSGYLACRFRNIDAPTVKHTFDSLIWGATEVRGEAYVIHLGGEEGGGNLGGSDIHLREQTSEMYE